MSSAPGPSLDTCAAEGGPLPPLLPCPFCGGAAEIWRATPGTTRKAWIACMSGCIALTKEHPTDAEAVARWNTRAEPRLPAAPENGPEHMMNPPLPAAQEKGGEGA